MSMTTYHGRQPSLDVVRRTWLASLAVAVRPLESEALVAKFVLLLSALERFPDAAFNQSVLLDIVDTAKGVPNLKDISRALDNWVARNQPRLSGPRSVEEWRAQKYPTWDPQETVASWQDPAPIRRSVRELQLRIAWGESGGEGLGGWMKAEPPPGRLPVDVAAERLYARVLAAAVKKNAPQHLGLLLPEWIEWMEAAEAKEKAEAETGRPRF